MPIFKYTAKNEHGESIGGKVEAKTIHHGVSILTQRGLLVIEIKPLGDESFAYFKSLVGGVKNDDLVNFTRQLSTMITAGLPLATALNILEEQSKPQVMRMVTNLLKEIEGGNTFSMALEKAKDIFSRVYIQLVRAGEVGGMLDGVLERLAETMEKDKEFRAKTKGALIYPIIVILAMIAVAFVMMIFVIPQLTSMYKDFDAELPIATKVLIGISDFFVKFWWLIIGMAGGGVYLFKKFYSTENGERLVDSYLLRIPVFGILRQKIILTEFARTLSLLLGAGVSLMEALDIVGEAMGSVTYREAVAEARKKVEKGISLSQAISSYSIFPPILHQMIAVGEETGKLNDVLLKLSTYFESESEHAVKNMTTALEPMIMIVLGVGVGAMVIAVIMPIYNLTSAF